MAQLTLKNANANPLNAAKASTSEYGDAVEPRMARPDRDQPHSDSRGGDSRVMSQREWETANAPTDPERRRSFREKWSATHLPNLPLKAGWHRCWVSTNHPTDTPARRIALGYSVLMLDEVKGSSWAPEADSVKDGTSVDGAVKWREMIGMQCPESLYQEYMREFHFDQPRDMARDIYAALNQAGDEVRERGGRIELGDGFQEMNKFRRPDRQFE